jgi:pimeloyl-ACP methyl ester carboxylesterase
MRRGIRRLTIAFSLVVIGAMTVSCTASVQPSPPATASEPEEATTSEPEAAVTASAPADPARIPSVEGRFAVGHHELEVALVCWGQGSPTVILEAGGPNIEQWTGSGIVRELAPTTRVCTYDRPGTGQSDPPPNEQRDADDAITLLQEVLAVAEVDGPYVLLGRSFGGMIVTHYAAEMPDGLVGVVVLDTPAPSAEWSDADRAELAWDNPGNTERLDVLEGFETRFANDPPEFDLPLLLISPMSGESSPEDQAFWLDSSPQAEQVTPNCSEPTSGECATEVLEFVQRVAAGA